MGGGRITEVYLSVNLTANQIHQVLYPRTDSDIQKFHAQAESDRAASPGSTIKTYKLTETTAEVLA